jgi:putative phage-type endonuclease
MLTDAQREARLSGLGGSDAAAAAGLSPWKTPLELWLEKTRRLESVVLENEAIRWGNLLEPVIRQEYERRFSRALAVPAEPVRSPRAEFLMCLPDGLADDRLVEIKTTGSSHGWGKQGTDQVPMHYLIQVQHNLLVTERELADLVVLIGGQDFRVYPIPADHELQAMLLEVETAFWAKVQADIQPEPTWESPRALDLVKRLHAGTDGSRIEADDELVRWRMVRDEALEKARSYQAVADGAMAHLLWRMGAASELAFPDGKALRRRLVQRKGYTVEPGEYMDIRFVNLKE